MAPKLQECRNHITSKTSIKVMILYRFLNEEYGLQSIEDCELKLTRLMDLNDPFEFISVELSNPCLRNAVLKAKEEISKTAGILCFSSTWKNPLLWSHYADKHEGICLGFEVPESSCGKINYVDSRLKAPDWFCQPLARKSIQEKRFKFMKKMIYTKFSHWSYEEEYRIWTPPKYTKGKFIFTDFDSAGLKLRKVIVGAKSSVTHFDVSESLGSISSGVKVFKARPSLTSFEMEIDEMES